MALCVGLHPPPLAAQEEEGAPSIEDIRTLFARSTSVLLPSGALEVELSASYLIDDEPELNERRRRGALVSTLRLGLLDRFVAFCGVPLIHAEEEQFTATGDEVTRSELVDSGLGDAFVGANYLLFHESTYIPETIVLGRYTVGTGQDEFEVEDDELPLGLGHDTVSGGLQFTTTSDAIAMYCGALYEHVFYRSEAGQKFEPGDAVEYFGGFGLGINDQVSLNAELRGRLRFRTEVDDATVEGTDSHLVELRLGVVHLLGLGLYAAPSVSVGLTDESADVTLGLALVYRF